MRGRFPLLLFPRSYSFPARPHYALLVLCIKHQYLNAVKKFLSYKTYLLRSTSLSTHVVYIDPIRSSKGLGKWPGCEARQVHAGASPGVLLAELANVLLVTIIARLLPTEWVIVLRIILRRPQL